MADSLLISQLFFICKYCQLFQEHNSEERKQKQNNNKNFLAHARINADQTNKSG